ncbi:hypothetical protein [Leptolyngbya sp. PCC 6406]|uniref:hypothetical protein n=1 Tax=Leptolyngbya sp. PCC 6406 TaxID=1173264 RepID=UPI0002ACC50C|nr:hypothetical protein [Leptolyngbya sp. PCC 6406]
MYYLRSPRALYWHCLDTLGNWNPQLLRELKSRLRVGPVLLTVVLSLLLQAGVVMGFWGHLPDDLKDHDTRMGTFPDIDLSVSGQTVSISDVFDQVLVHPDVGALPTQRPDIRPGDRLLVVNGNPIAAINPNAVSSDQAYRDQQLKEELLRNIRTNGAEVTWGRDRESPLARRLLGSIIELTLSREGRGEFTVALPRAWVTDIRGQYCIVDPANHTETYSYPPRCLLTTDGSAYQVNWQPWSWNVFLAMGSTLATVAIGLGSFLLISNLGQEGQRGTLALVQLSPRSGLSVLLGQLLGVPIWVYLSLALALPLQLYLGIQAGLGLLPLAIFCAVTALHGTVFFSGAMVLGLLAPKLARFLAFLVSSGFAFAELFMLQMGQFQMGRYGFQPSMNWVAFFTPFFALGDLSRIDLSNPGSSRSSGLVPDYWVTWFLGHDVGRLSYLVLMVTLGLGLTVGLWQMMLRRYANGQQSLMARSSSYWLTGAVWMLVLGFTLLREGGFRGFYGNLAPLMSIAALVLVGLTIALTPPTRQTLQDWARFRHQRSRPTPAAPVGRRSSLWRELIWADNSPPAVALSLHALLIAALTVAWIGWAVISQGYGVTPLSDLPSDYPWLMRFWWLDDVFRVISLLAMAIIYGLLAQLIYLSPLKRSAIWALAMVLVGIALQTVAVINGFTWLNSLGIEQSVSALLLGAFSPWQSLGSWPIFILSCVVQGTAIAALGTLHWRQVQRIGQSNTQALLNAPPRRLRHGREV